MGFVIGRLACWCWRIFDDLTGWLLFLRLFIGKVEHSRIVMDTHVSRTIWVVGYDGRGGDLNV